MREKGSMCPVCARAWCVRELESVGTRARKSCVFAVDSARTCTRPRPATKAWLEQSQACCPRTPRGGRLLAVNVLPCTSWSGHRWRVRADAASPASWNINHAQAIVSTRMPRSPLTSIAPGPIRIVQHKSGAEHRHHETHARGRLPPRAALPVPRHAPSKAFQRVKEKEKALTSLHPPRLCRFAVFSVKPTFLSSVTRVCWSCASVD